MNTSTVGKDYTIDPSTSVLTWEASKPLGSHHGIVPIKEGSVSVQDGRITGGKVTLDMANLQVTDLEGNKKADLEAHLKGRDADKETDFFNTDKYPTAVYVIKNTTVLENDPEGNTHNVSGELTLKDITHPVDFKAKVDLNTPDVIKISSVKFEIDRTAWGIKYRSPKFAPELKDDLIKDEIKIDFNITAKK